MTKSIFTSIIGSSILLAAAAAPGAVIEGFENTADPGGWRSTSPAGQTQNAQISQPIPNYLTQQVTEGTRSGELFTTWTLPGAVHTGNAYISGGPTTYWSSRFDVANPNNFPGNVISTVNGVIQGDFYNNNPYPIQVAFYVDEAAGAQLERGPLVEVAANSALTYNWKLAETTPTAFVIGNGAWNTPTARFKGVLVYTDVEPTVNSFSLIVDNIHNPSAQVDTTPPAPVVPYSARQGAASGDLLVTWMPNTETDLAGYNIYVAPNSDFSNATINRITFPLTPTATAGAAASSITISGQPTNENLFVRITAIDNATPTANESQAGITLGARLHGDGTAGEHTVVLDHDRQAPGTASFSTEGYSHAIAYNARALSANNYYFGSVNARAIDDGAATLTPAANSVTIWSNLMDGNATSTVALTTSSVTALTNFLNADGNLLISGAGLSEDLSSRGPAQQAFLANQLSASLVNPAHAPGVEFTGTAPLASMGTVRTDANNFTNISAFQIGNTNEQLAPLGAAVATGTYTGSATPDTAVVNANRTVLLGYAFESVAGANSAASETARAALLQDVFTYLFQTSSSVNDWSVY